MRSPRKIPKLTKHCTRILAVMMCSSFCSFAQDSRAVVADVPFVGCTTYGQSERYPPPAKPKRVVELPPDAAQKLAYYESAIGPGVLAPRDWSCECLSGSSGSLFRITPHPLARNKLEIDGAAILVSDSDGEASGRYEIAAVIARIFPDQWTWARRTLEGLDDAYDVRYRPYPADRLTYQSNRVVEYRTAPNSQGLGTRGALKANTDPIEGVVILQAEPPDRLFRLAVRLPPDLQSLTPLIIKNFEAGTSLQPRR